MQQIEITAGEAGQRFSKMLERYLSEASKSFIYKMLRKKNITLNGKRASGNEKLEAGDQVKLFLADETIAKFSRTEMIKKTGELDIIYEDDDILLINKPVGLLSQKAGPDDISVVEYVISYLYASGQATPDGLRRFHPAVCNRLDRNTSGLIAAGKSITGLQEMGKMFHDRTLEKFYLCVVAGRITKAEYIKGYLHKDKTTNQVTVTAVEKSGSLPIETEYVPLAAGSRFSLLEVHLITGRAHQIRAHLSSIGHPVAGDYKYGSRPVNDRLKKIYGLKSQLLHSYRLELPSDCGGLPRLAGRRFIASPPLLFKKIVKEVIDVNLELERTSGINSGGLHQSDK